MNCREFEGRSGKGVTKVRREIQYWLMNLGQFNLGASTWSVTSLRSAGGPPEPEHFKGFEQQHEKGKQQTQNSDISIGERIISHLSSQGKATKSSDTTSCPVLDSKKSLPCSELLVVRYVSA
jgi:hypothetical protein